MTEYFTLTYNANGGSGAPAAQTGSGAITLSRTQPTRTGYTFLGWATSASATSASYQPGETISLGKSLTLYAVWKKNMIYCPYCGMEFVDEEAYNSHLTLWNHNDGHYLECSYCGEKFSDEDMWKEHMKNCDKNPTSYTLTYNANGGSGAPAAQTGNGTITLSRTQPTRTGYTFRGWATSAGATAAQYQPGASFSLTKNTTLYAVWQQIPVTPQNPLANAKVYAGSPATVEYRANVTVTFTATGVPEGYHLVVVKEANGNTTVIAAGDHRSASAELGEVTESCEVYAWIIKDGASAGAAERDENGKVIGTMTSVNVNTGFLVRLIAFFKGLFGLLPKVEIKP